MIDTRLSIALDRGGLTWPDKGLIAVFHPPASADLSGCPTDRTVVVQPDYVAHRRFVSQGYKTCVEPNDTYAASIVCLPRAKRLAMVLVAQAHAVTDGQVVVDGQKTDGVDSILKAMRARAPLSPPISKAHGKLFWSQATDVFEDWAEGPILTPGGFWTAPGVFSADAIDPASALLAGALPDDLGAHVADLGAGWGFLSAHILTRDNVRSVHLVEAGHLALECARRNVTDPRAAFHWDDATTWKAPQALDTVVMNPPFHIGRTGDPDIGRAFITAAAGLLGPRGQLWMVANRHLPYEATLSTEFGKVTEAGGDGRFKVFNASKPLRKRK